MEKSELHPGSALSAHRRSAAGSRNLSLPRRAAMRALALMLAFLAACGLPQAGFAAAEDVTCTPSAPTINFGPYDVLSGSVLDAAGSFTVTCAHNKTTTITVTYTRSEEHTSELQSRPHLVC